MIFRMFEIRDDARLARRFFFFPHTHCAQDCAPENLLNPLAHGDGRTATDVHHGRPCADRERRRRAHQQAQQAAAASDERQAQADESQEAPAQAVQRDEEPVVARAVAAPINAVVVADIAPVAAVAVPPAPPAPQEERYPDVDAELLGEEIRRERTQIDGFDARATAVCDLLAEAERKLAEAERMEAALLADDDDGGADQ